MEESKRQDFMDIEQEEQQNQQNYDQEFEIPPIQQLTHYEEEELKEQALKFKQLYDEFEQNFSSDENTEYYIVSNKWFRNWKIYVSYNEFISENRPTIFLGGKKPFKYNQNLIDFNVQKLFDYCVHNHTYNTWLKQGLVCDRDYIIVDSEINTFFHLNYPGGYQIKRMAHISQNRKEVEVNYRRLNCILLTNQHMRNIDGGSKQNFERIGQLQISNNLTYKAFFKMLQLTLKNDNSMSLPMYDEYLRVWKLKTGLNMKNFFDFIYKSVKNYQNYDYKIRFDDGEYLDPEPEQEEEKNKVISDFNICPEDLLIFEVKESPRQWCFHNKQVLVEDRCEGCSKMEVLRFICACKKVGYCTENCQKRDWQFHQNKCDKIGEEDEAGIEALVETQESRLGLTGLRNIGNTCFMNSGLQCLSNCYELTKYFLDLKYKNELNTDNPLGQNGDLAKAYAFLIRKLWLDKNNEIPPWQFKRAISKFATIFQGFAQHDSQELVSFVLDGLHEDLNLVKVKPGVENNDSNGRPDLIVAKEFWDNYQKRNRSVISDLFAGQYKSRVECPTCGRINITFDTFTSVSLPIPQETSRKVEFKYIQNGPGYQHKTMTVSFDKQTTPKISHLKQMIANITGDEAQNLDVYLSGSYKYESEIKDDEEANEVRKKCRWRALVIRPFPPQEISIPQEKKYFIIFTHKKQQESYGGGFKKNITFVRRIFFNTDLTLKELHLQLFSMWKHYFKGKIEENLSDQENYEKYFLNQENRKEQFWEIQLESNSRGFYTCIYCGQSRCYNCHMPYSDEIKLQEYVDKAKQTIRDSLIEIEIYWKVFSDQYKNIDDFFEIQQQDEQKIKDESQQQQPQQPQQQQLTLKDCLKLFDTPEVLGEDNAWYCSVCKEHKQATKQMTLYKASNYLIFQLKRFKDRKNSMFLQKITQKIEYSGQQEDFTIDLQDHILNNNLPSDYEREILEETTLKPKTPLNYRLIGVTHHYGGMGGGHYAAHVWNNRKKMWYYCDDSSVRQEQNLSNIVSDSGYVLFFKRIQKGESFEQQEIIQSITMQQDSSQQQQQQSQNNNNNDSNENNNLTNEKNNKMDLEENKM